VPLTRWIWSRGGERISDSQILRESRNYRPCSRGFCWDKWKGLGQTQDLLYSAYNDRIVYRSNVRIGSYDLMKFIKPSRWLATQDLSFAVPSLLPILINHEKRGRSRDSIKSGQKHIARFQFAHYAVLILLL
jgi:hypothetical protein